MKLITFTSTTTLIVTQMVIILMLYINLTYGEKKIKRQYYPSVADELSSSSLSPPPTPTSSNYYHSLSSTEQPPAPSSFGYSSSGTYNNDYDDNTYYYNNEQEGRTLKKRRKESAASIIKKLDRRHPDGTYNYEYLTDNGIHSQESSVQHGRERIVRGSYSYIGPDGKTYRVDYIADRNGYRAYGAHLPTQPDAVANIITQASQQQQQQDFGQTTGGDYVVPIIPIYTRPTSAVNSLTSLPAQQIVHHHNNRKQEQQYHRHPSTPYYSSSTTPSSLQSSTPIFIGTTPQPPISFGYSSSTATPLPPLSISSTTPSSIFSQTTASTPSSALYDHNDLVVGVTPETVYITPSPKTYVNSHQDPHQYHHQPHHHHNLYSHPQQHHHQQLQQQSDEQLNYLNENDLLLLQHEQQLPHINYEPPNFAGYPQQQQQPIFYQQNQFENEPFEVPFNRQLSITGAAPPSNHPYNHHQQRNSFNDIQRVQPLFPTVPTTNTNNNNINNVNKDINRRRLHHQQNLYNTDGNGGGGGGGNAIGEFNSFSSIPPSAFDRVVKHY